MGTSIEYNQEEFHLKHARIVEGAMVTSLEN